MHRFEFVGIKTGDVDAGAAKKLQLPIKSGKIGAAFVIDKGFGQQGRPKAQAQRPDAENNIFAHAANLKTVRLFPNLPRKPHIETARVENTAQICFFTPNAARREDGGHGIANGFLNGREVGVVGVGATV